MCLGRGGERCLSYYVQSRGHEVCPGVHGVCVSWGIRGGVGYMGCVLGHIGYVPRVHGVCVSWAI